MRRSSMGLLLAIVACALLYTCGNGSTALFDRDEPWYAQCSKMMWQSGDWVVPKYLTGEIRPEKPVFIYWVQLGTMAIWGDNPFGVRFASVVGMTLLLIILGLTIARTIGIARAAWTVFILGTCALVIAAGKMCLTDAVMLLWLTIAQLCIYVLWRGKGRWWTMVLMWIAIGLAGLTKGPITLVPPIMTVLMLVLFDFQNFVRQLKFRESSFWRKLALVTLGLLTGLAIIGLINGPWLLELHSREPRWLPSVFKIAKSHITTAMEGHSGPPGYYLILMWVTFFPWSLLIPTAVVLAWRHRHLPPIRFAIAAVVGPWIFQELMTTKLPHYILPAYPPLAFLTADALVRCIRGQYPDLVKPVWIKSVGVWAIVIGLIGTIGPWVPAFWFRNVSWGAMAACSMVAILNVTCVFWFFYKRQVARAAVALGGGWLILVCLLYGWYFPKADFLRMSIHAAEVLKREGLLDKSDALMVDYREPSLVYYLNGNIPKEDQADEDYLLKTDPAQWPRWMVLTNHGFDRLPTGKQAMLELIPGAQFPGFNYTGAVTKSDGSRTGLIELRVYRKKWPMPQ